eukprot:TRINITY_DN2429_c0_g1_i1.p1 TRINITY_DN2429_c0_g1~~TRINITY_DN2429_c0_g1_i1.p1  ORF type:complete len:208 (+),score=49.04 TRINITY_DN2429_c0_g1_i1:156-779(+)
MVKLFSAILYNCSSKPVQLAAAFEVTEFGFFKRGTVKEFLSFASREVAGRTRPGEKQSIKHHAEEAIEGYQDFVLHCSLTPQKLGCVLVTDGAYSMRLAYDLIRKVIDEAVRVYGDKLFTFTVDTTLQLSSLQDLFVKYQKPQEVDQMAKLQRDIDETKDVLFQTMDKLLQRGEKLEDLAQKSQDLSLKSKAFMKQSKQLNRCCNVM